MKQVRRYMGEIPDKKWTNFFCDFYSLLDDETRAKYTIYGLDCVYNANSNQIAVKVKDMSYSLMSESTVYRAMAAICEAEGDFYLTKAFLMCARSCIPPVKNESCMNEIRLHQAYERNMDKIMRTVEDKESTRNLLNEWSDLYV